MNEEVLTFVENAISQKISKSKLIKILGEHGVSKEESKVYIKEAFNEINIKTWRSYLIKNPLTTDISGFLLCIFSLILGLLFSFFVVSLIPSHKIIGFMAIIPMLIGVFISFYLFAPIFFKLRK